MKSLIVLFFLLLQTTMLISQENETVEIDFNPVFLSERLNLNQYYKLNQNDSIQFSIFKFYISNIEFTNKNKSVWKISPGFYLIDLENENSLKLKSLIPRNIDFDKLSFDLGIDSTTNVSGAFGGALDPTQGMYWSWQSGYINLKLEGNCNQSVQSNSEFIFHLGGYKSPNNAIQKISFQTINKPVYQIEVELNNLVSVIDFKTISSVMSPRQEAVDLAKKATKMFVLK